MQDAFRGALFALDMSEKFDDFALCEARFYKRIDHRLCRFSETRRYLFILEELGQC